MEEYGNIIYFRSILKIGGIETFLQNLTNLYKDRDITILCHDCDNAQLKKLRKKCRVIIWDGVTKYKCKVFICNFNREVIDFIEADKYYLVLHGDYRDMVNREQLTMALLPIHKKIDQYIAVSKVVADSWEYLTGIKAKVVYNPIVIDEQKPKPIRLLSAQRLSREKGGYRIVSLAKKLDEYCKRNGEYYEWDIYTNDYGMQEVKKLGIDKTNITLKKSRDDIKSIMWQYDWFISLTDNEGYCYSVVEALSDPNNVPCVVTPVPVFKELGINASNSITLEFDLSNIDEVVSKIFNTKLSFNYEPKKDTWGEILTKDIKTYQGGNEKMVTVRANFNYHDTYEDIHTVKGQEYETTEERANILANTFNADEGLCFAEIVKTPSVEVLEETPKKKNAKRKTK